MIKLSLISSATLLCVEAGVVTVVNTIQNRWFEINFQFCSRIAHSSASNFDLTLTPAKNIDLVPP